LDDRDLAVSQRLISVSSAPSRNAAPGKYTGVLLLVKKAKRFVISGVLAGWE